MIFGTVKKRGISLCYTVLLLLFLSLLTIFPFKGARSETEGDVTPHGDEAGGATQSESTDHKHEIRVLITDGKAPVMPDKDEPLERIGDVKGKLLVDGSAYRGKIEVYRGKKGLYLVNSLPLEDYVKGVVKSEVAAGWEDEALKAQAVIVRTYAVNHILKNADSLYHLTSSTLHQMYKGTTFDADISNAVDDTAGEILTYKGKPIMAYYHSTCGGRTELPEEVFGKSFPYLKSVTNDCTISPLSIWERKIPYSEIEAALGLPPVKKIKVETHTKTGRAKILNIETEESVTYIETKELRRIIGWKRIPSTLFTLKNDEGRLIIEGRGYGHGVGLCQWGALQLDRKGNSYREILSYYYPNTTITLYADL